MDLYRAEPEVALRTRRSAGAHGAPSSAPPPYRLFQPAEVEEAQRCGQPPPTVFLDGKQVLQVAQGFWEQQPTAIPHEAAVTDWLMVDSLDAFMVRVARALKVG